MCQDIQRPIYHYWILLISVSWVSQPGGGGSRLCSPNNTGTPGFPDLPTALNYTVWYAILAIMDAWHVNSQNQVQACRKGGGTVEATPSKWALEVSWAQTGQTHLQSTHFFILIRNLPFLTIPCYINLGEIQGYFCRNLQKIEGAEKSLLQISDFSQLLPNYSTIRPFQSLSVRLWFKLV